MTFLSDDALKELITQERRARQYTWRRFSVVICAPILAVAILAGMILARDYAVWKNATVQLKTAVTSEIMVRLVLELQRERGLSVGFLSNPSGFDAKLAERRTAVDAAVAALSAKDAELASRGDSAALDRIRAKIADTLAATNRALSLRGAVDAQSVTRAALVEGYTQAVESLIRASERKTIVATTEDQTALADFAGDILRAIEFGGRERAFGASGFGGGFDGPTYRQFIMLGAQQQTYLREALAAADVALTSEVEAVLSGAATAQLDAYRAMAKPGGAAPGAPSGAAWFVASTAQLDALAAVHAKALRDINAATKAQAAAAFSDMLMVTVLSIAAVAVTLVLLIGGVGGFVFRLTLLLRSLQRLARGGGDVKVQGGGSKDITGALAGAVRSIARQGSENTQVRAALHVTQSQIMIANADGQIMFVNNALETSADESMEYFMEILPDFEPFLVFDHLYTLAKDALSDQGVTLERLEERAEVDVRYDNRIFEVTATPVADLEGLRIGTTFEWREVTATRAIEVQLAEMINATRAGDFSRRIDIEANQKFLDDIANGMNEVASEIYRFIIELKGALGALAEGDLTRRVEGAYSGDLAQLADDTNATIAHLRNLVALIMDQGVGIQQHGTVIRDGSESLAGRSKEATESLEKTATAMEEISATVESSAEVAQKADRLAASARDSAETSGAIVDEAVQAMGRIRESSENITDIVTVIDSIAFQTNLLALNAAVEAARAGPQGKGFAVVAQEVRALAQRSADAAGDIKRLIEESTQNVAEGVELVEKTGGALGEIRAVISETSDKIRQINEAAGEQSLGVREIFRTVSWLDEMVRETAGVARSNAGAAQTLAAGADDLSSLVRQFQIDTAAEANAA